MHRFASSLLLLFSATVFVPSVGRCDDSEDPLTVDEVVANWRLAVGSIESVDVQFVRFEADLLAESIAISNGRLAIDHGRRVATSFEPDDGPFGELLKGRSGEPFERRKGGKGRWIVDHQMILFLDDDKQEAMRQELAQPLPPVPVPKVESVEPDAGFFERLCSLGSATQISLITNFQLIGPFETPLENLPQLTEDLKTRFDIQIVDQTPSDVRLRLTPLRRFDRASVQQIDIILSRESWLPEAVRFLDPPGTKTTTFVITKRRINECSEQMDDAFRVNLEQYQCHTIPRSVPTVSSSHGDTKP